MMTKDRELFVHCHGAKPQVVRASAGESLHRVFVRAGVVQEEGQDEFFAFVGESSEALPLNDAGNAAEQDPVDPSLTVDELDPQQRHVHCYCCRHVDVGVNFHADTERSRFSPTTTIDVVTRWACRKFEIDDAAEADYVLRFSDVSTQPRSDKYLGELVQDTHVLCFDLVAEIIPQG